MVKKILPHAGTALLLICALTVTGLVVRRELFSSADAAAVHVQSRTVPQWREYARGERIGPGETPVTIVEFSDFQCPFCREMADRIREVRRRHPDEVALVYRHYPLPYHTHAVAAARSSICAGRQGRFEAYHDALFASQDSLGLIPWTELAARAGVPDTAAFSACARQDGPVPEIERDLQAGTRLGVEGTPAILVNDRLLFGAAPGVLEDLVAEALRASTRR